MMETAISVNHATKRIGERVVLDDVSVDLCKGAVHGFVGVNGSGKTMLFRAIAGLISLDEGSVEVFGKIIGRDVDYPCSLGLTLEAAGLWDEYTGLQNLQLLASIRNEIGYDEIIRALERVGLDPQDKRRFRAYSLGMKQRLAIAQAIMESPELLILDEPTIALDVEAIEMVTKIISEERDRGATVLIACHNEPTLEALFESVHRMVDGRIVEEIRS